MQLVVHQSDAREIKVKLLLAGGHLAALVLPPKHPLLAQLLAAVADVEGESTETRAAVFQIPIEDGRVSLAFAAHQLVGVITDPAVVVRSDKPAELKAPEHEARAVPAAHVAALAAAAAQGQSELIRHPVVQLDGFLTGSEVAWLMELTFAAESRFVPSRVGDYRERDYRHSLVLIPPADFRELITGKIRAVMPEVLRGLGISQLTVGKIDCQITASIDGSYFKVHTDAGPGVGINRVLTYVYYFNRELKGFTGGELRVYDDTIRNGGLVATHSFQVIEPRHNSIVFFQAGVSHEVMPVAVPSKQFRDARFTVNGWIDRG